MEVSDLIKIGRAMRDLTVAGAHSYGVSDGSNDAVLGLNNPLLTRAQNEGLELLCTNPDITARNREDISAAYLKGYTFSQVLHGKYSGKTKD